MVLSLEIPSIFSNNTEFLSGKFFVVLDSFAVKKSVKPTVVQLFNQRVQNALIMFENCSFDDAIVALVHVVAKHPTFSILSSRFSTHNYRLGVQLKRYPCDNFTSSYNRISYLPVTLLGHHIFEINNKFIARFYFPFSCFPLCSFLISSCEFFYPEHLQTCYFVLST